MGQVTAVAERTIAAPADKVRALVADYSVARPKILTDHYREYQVLQGGSGAGTRVRWILQATSKRSRDVVAEVTEPGADDLVETDQNSTMVTTWTVRPEGTSSVVRVETTWQGAGGIGGFFEGVFAPAGLKRIYDSVLDKLETLATQA